MDETTNLNRQRRQPLGDILIAQGWLTQSQLEEALKEQKSTQNKLGETIVLLGMATEEQVTKARALQLDVKYINLQEQEFDPEALALVPQSIARTYKLIPIQIIGDKLIVAMENPMDIEAIDLLQYETKLRIDASLSSTWRISDAINRQYGSETTDDIQRIMDQVASTDKGEIDDGFDDSSEDIDEVKRQSHAAPIVRMVNLLLTQGIRKKASDIHIEPRRDRLDVRYRIDGELYLVKSIPKTLQPGVASRIKIMSELDISERRLPQDGRITVKIDGKKCDLRVSTSPSLYGERIVLRVLRRSEGVIPLDQLGFSQKDTVVFSKLISRPNGIILVTGPTGSGKTTTLYAALNMLKSERVNIMTVEDPIEYEMDGINQTNIHPKIGLTFAHQLRSILRQDPDIVLLGEIRDTETADVAFRAALTGHLVLSTLHANDAPSAINRLVDMGVDRFLVNSAINGVTAQRLLRVLCPDCKRPYEADEETKVSLGLNPHDPVTLYEVVGCSSCGQTGYSGRSTICEVLTVDEEIQRLIMGQGSAAEIRHAAVTKGMVTMQQDGINKLLAGLTTIEELRRKVLIETMVLED